ncbi:hypothetical protein BABINDRAFT_32450 [Babjeviella inositovora NRRL Y-12698]|uniref:2-methylcitrate dehydratase n=1 Tax=Babjeviella inositovora NRRL Y-12698 TaxID=984486 RepID=A0A1E3QXP6_9ASCO|nr:uncharacterized protein BABINDRAFT_32450 [Babjeviella inositovora NRRL Y-12698]ODQ81807.1 hypothetical protein BABINDRAFT_32450 [Babjeviella inositovora NRRL Y-12698]
MSSTTAHSGAAAIMNDNARPESDAVLKSIASYIHNYKVDSTLAKDTARLCFLDTLGCGIAALKYPNCTALIQPVVPGTKVPNATRVFGTDIEHDPIRGAFAIGTIIRWLDYNDCWLAAEWGHPSDNLGGILAVADHLTRLHKSTNGADGQKFTVGEVLEYMIKAHEIQGILALENSYNKVGLDHVLLVKVATTAVVSQMLGLSEQQTIDALSHAFIDGSSLRTYRHAPNTMSRKSWAAGDACYRAVNLVYHVKNGETGMPSALTAKTWGFYDVLFKGKPFELNQDFGAYVMENVLFKISYPAEFHAQSAVECALKVHEKLAKAGKSFKDIKKVTISTQDAGMRIIDKKGPLHNYADRDHCIQYMVAIPLIHGRLTADDYSDAIASNPEIDALREKMECQENKEFTADYYAADKRYIGNSLDVELTNGEVFSESIDYPVGHRKRREEGKPLIYKKFEANLNQHFEPAQVKKILEASYDKNLDAQDVSSFMDLWVKN